jgi:hypothetical protein
MENTTDLTEDVTDEVQEELDEMEASEQFATKDVTDESLQDSLNSKYDNTPKKEWDISEERGQYFVIFKDGNGVYEMEITKREYNNLRKL